MHPPKTTTLLAPDDHRVHAAARKRRVMRERLLAATVRVFAAGGPDTPVIEDVVREAGVSRASFYQHFNSLDHAYLEMSLTAVEQFVRELSPLTQAYLHPWQRNSVGCRLMFERAWHDVTWARLMRRPEIWLHESLLNSVIRADLEEGRSRNQYQFEHTGVMLDILNGAITQCILVLGRGVSDPEAYIDAALRTLLRASGCDPALCERAVAFSRLQVGHYRERAIGDRPIAG